MLPANRSPPMCVDSHVCSGNAWESADASGRPRSAQHGSRRPCVQTANRALSTGARPTERPCPSASRSSVATSRTSSRSARSIHGRSGPVWIAKHAGAPPAARPWRRISRTLIRSSRSRRRSVAPRPSGRRAWWSARSPHGPGCSSRSQFVMVDAVPRSGSSAASLAWEQRNDGSVTAAGRPQSSRRTGSASEEPLAHQTTGEDEARRRIGEHGRQVADGQRVGRGHRSAWRAPATRACPAGGRRAARPAIHRRRSAARRRSPVVA